jgi:hypothetical protein
MTETPKSLIALLAKRREQTARKVITNQARAERFMALGLTWRGKPRIRKIRFDLAGLSRQARHTITVRDRRRWFIGQGLTWCGKKRKRFLSRLTGGQWKKFRSEMTVSVLHLETSSTPIGRMAA